LTFSQDNITQLSFSPPHLQAVLPPARSPHREKCSIISLSADPQRLHGPSNDLAHTFSKSGQIDRCRLSAAIEQLA
jgi:hypothetical protein